MKPATPADPFTIALAGNPNCGKTTLFNALTGSRQKVGNWAGVTVEKKTGQLRLDGADIQVVDLPGVYSLNQTDQGVDEQIARRFITEQKPDLIVNLVDASNLNRNLLLTHELLELGCPTLIALNMLDVAEKQGTHIDVDALQRNLGVPVIPIVASKGDGLEQLTQTLQHLNRHPEHAPKPKQDLLCEEEAITHRYQWVRQQTQGVMVMQPDKRSLTQSIDNIVLNRWFGIPIFLGMMYLMFMLAINLGAVFIDFFDILLGTLLIDGLGHALNSIGAPAWVVTILADGLGGGIQLVGTFIPVIGFLYLCLSLLEDSGYMARAAFVVDRLMARIGLPGNAFVPLIVGFGCNVPAVMASRSLTREQDRLLTIAMAPFMSCGARLTVYALFTTAFFTEYSSLIVFALYLFGITVAVLTGWLFRKTLFKGQASPSFQEMPTYHLPLLRNTLITTWHRLYGFIRRAGVTIIKVVTLLTLINSIGVDGSFGNQDSKDSLLSAIGKSLTPALAPIGVQEDNWPATVGVFTGIFAKEAVVGTLDALYQDVAGDDSKNGSELNIAENIQEAFASIGNNLVDLSRNLTDPLGLSAVKDSLDDQGVSNTGLKAMQDLFGSPFAAFCYLVLILLYTPCVAVMGAMNRESGPFWASLVIGWSSFLAYWCASVIYQIGSFLNDPVFAGSWIFGAVIAMVLVVQGLKRFGTRSGSREIHIIARG
ncbi:ferrous iron transport protein B [Pseudomaricurvus alkylphenolicus]|uniref:ferrous iron transport protein B n=1 Tax=Pseudomaricurvus alkylphenolicus TaxID=1306991 RepID=UPI001423D1B0|nr:ferrous iron transport protein B [Pseudomaricurvus alkylphenolicus]